MPARKFFNFSDVYMSAMGNISGPRACPYYLDKVATAQGLEFYVDDDDRFFTHVRLAGIKDEWLVFIDQHGGTAGLYWGASFPPSVTPVTGDAKSIGDLYINMTYVLMMKKWFSPTESGREVMGLGSTIVKMHRLNLPGKEFPVNEFFSLGAPALTPFYRVSHHFTDQT